MGKRGGVKVKDGVGMADVNFRVTGEGLLFIIESERSCELLPDGTEEGIDLRALPIFGPQ